MDARMGASARPTASWWTTASFPSAGPAPARALSLPGNDHQHQLGGMLAIVVNGLVGLQEPHLVGHGTAGIRIAVEPREVAARNLDPDPVPLEEHVARDARIHG